MFHGYRVSVLQDDNKFYGQVVVIAAMVKMVTPMHILPQLKKKTPSTSSSVQPLWIFKLLLNLQQN